MEIFTHQTNVISLGSCYLPCSLAWPNPNLEKNAFTLNLSFLLAHILWGGKKKGNGFLHFLI